MRLSLSLAMILFGLPTAGYAAGPSGPSLPQSIEYSGFTGSTQYPVFNDFTITNDGGALGGSAFMQIGIFSGAAPITGTYVNGECTAIRKKQTFRGPCNASEFSGTIYDSKGKPGEAFRFVSKARLAQLKANGGGAAIGAADNAGPAAVNTGVWSLGRARFLVEPRGGCPPQIALGTRSYCFNQAIDWLRRHPDHQSVDVVAMQASWTPGTFVPHNNGVGWNIYKVARKGDGFTADKQLHYATRVQVPQGCIYAGVARQAWYITVAGRGKVAVEAAEYACTNPWSGNQIYAQNLDMREVDAAPGDIQLSDASPVRAASEAQAQNGDQSSAGADWGGPQFRQNWLSGTSAMIYGSPATPAPPSKRKKH